ncbi:hypothetical protein GRI89_14375 [Altererythrobacter salegens]|uniref:Sulfotransferase domain-containing protein n=1 Tax=Croceibacterium salegens TaxID=1737568 RepID=A0A6I4SXH3_9SPHN|nr:sulfotransferase domain-containing protein [Croceibacterium salegens]MXO60725.1 hypothetical protein [Croceibacterium salegens]
MARYPDFLIFGAAKSGTTTLFDFLRRHPQVFLPEIKEPEFYSIDEKFLTARAWYEGLFAQARIDQVVGEGSQTYSMWPHFAKAPERIATELPNVKLVYIMRDPIERAYSFYLQLVKMGQITRQNFRISRTFEECLFPDMYPDRCSHETFMGSLAGIFPDDPGLFLDPSDYALQIERYSKFYSRDRFHLMVFEEIIADCAHQIESLFRFLGLTELGGMHSISSAKTNVSSDYFATAQAMDAMMRAKRNTTLTRIASITPNPIKALTKRALLLYSAREKSISLSRPAPMQPQTRVWLQEYFAPRLKRLAELTDLDVSIWTSRWNSPENGQPNRSDASANTQII